MICLEEKEYAKKKIKSKRIRDLNAKLRAIKLLEENIGRTLFDINPRHIFLDQSPKE